MDGKAKRITHHLSYRVVCGPHLRRDGSAGKLMWVEESEDSESVCQSRLIATEAVADRPGRSAGAVRPDARCV